ncbi:MAG: DivIVA domain-containing protein [Acidimicrobiales bacterium]
MAADSSRHGRTPTAPGALDPDRVARAEFSTSFRGFDQTEVRSFLAWVAGELRSLLAEKSELTGELAEVRRRAPAATLAELDDERLMETIGIETARVLRSARDAAGEIANSARVEADQLLEQTRAEAERIVEEAHGDSERLCAEARAEGEAHRSTIEEDLERQRRQLTADAEELMGAADLYASQTRAEAELLLQLKTAEADAAAAALLQEAAAVQHAAHAQAEAELAASRERGREMVGEAKAVREKILTDMARRRNVARQQVERLRAGRERLLAAYEVVRETLAQATDELSHSMADAKLAADRAARRVNIDDLPPLDQLEAEVELARRNGIRPEPLGDDDTDDDDLADHLESDQADALNPVEEAATLELTAAESDTIELDTAELDLVEVKPAGGSDAAAAAEDAELANAPAARVQRRRGRAQAPKAPPAGGEPATADGHASPPDLEDLFARLRAERETPTLVLARADQAGDPPAFAGEPEAEPAAVGGRGEEGDQALLRRRDALADGSVKDLARQLKRALSDDQNQLLEMIRTHKGVLADAELPAEAEQVAEYEQRVLPELAAAAAAGRRFSGPDGHPAGEPEVGDLAAELAAGITQPLREKLTRAFDDAAGDADNLAGRVRAVYREARSRSVNQLADHYVLAAFNRGAAAGLGGAPGRWVCDQCGPDCQDNALAGPVPAGEAFPTGHLHPPAHVGCRCLLGPVGSE